MCSYRTAGPSQPAAVTAPQPGHAFEIRWCSVTCRGAGSGMSITCRRCRPVWAASTSAAPQPRQRVAPAARCGSGCRPATVTTRTRPAACPACAPTAFATSAWAPAWPHGGYEDGGYELFDETAPSRRCGSAIRSACRRTKAASGLQDGQGSAKTATKFANHDDNPSRHAHVTAAPGQ